MHLILVLTISASLLIFMDIMWWSALLGMELELCIILSHLSFIMVSIEYLILTCFQPYLLLAFFNLHLIVLTDIYSCKQFSYM